VDLFEYQARDLFESHQIPVLAGAVATTADEAFAAAEKSAEKLLLKLK
jgi:succinyl-CoA synthetase beta subunit